MIMLFCYSTAVMMCGVLSWLVKKELQAICSPTTPSSSRECTRNTMLNRGNGVVPSVTIVSYTLMQDQLTTAGSTFPLLSVNIVLFYIAHYLIMNYLLITQFM